jgi:hypothetical protein
VPRFLILNNAILFLCCSIYLGTGVSLVFFQIPIEPNLTVDNYRMIFIEPVKLATRFFTYMTIVMLVTGLLMLATEWLSGMRWVPVVVLAALIASTLIETQLIMPYNKELADGISDPARLKRVFSAWAELNRTRLSLWVIEWLAMMCYFGALAWRARADR